MKSVTLALAGVLLVSAFATEHASAAVASDSCDRACLYGLVGQYLKALVAHDPSRLPLAAHVKFTENTNTMKLGDGLWQTVNSVGTYTLYAADPQQGNVVYYGTVKENGRLALFAMRLKQQNRKLTQIETFVIRKATEHGVVFDTFMFAHPGNVPTRDWAATGLPATPNALSSYPNTTQVIEAFKVRNGKLYRIFAYISLLPYRQSPGW